ncbi:MAG: prephenate dehydrogenase [Clostridiales bacterium]|jgi:prephenate dehydrogenase|nr:prephenate dehydrogenase [Clostridiales bacterium]
MNIGIIGLGLIGGSLGRAIKEKTAHRVFGFDINPAVEDKAELLNAIDERLFWRTRGEISEKNQCVSGLLRSEKARDNSNSEIDMKPRELLNSEKKQDALDLLQSDGGACFGGNAGELDMLIYAVTPKNFIGAGGIRSIIGFLKKDAVVLDAAGTKAAAVSEMKRLAEEYPGVEFVAAHPMAGKEFSGVDYSSPSLFERASVLVVPVRAEIETLVRVKKFFSEIGFDYVRFTTADEHDRIIAYTSQLPHVLSSCYIGSPTAEFHSGFSAGSFRDLSRVARMSAPMWTELFTENRVNLLSELDGMIFRLNEMRNLIASNDAEGLTNVLQKNSDKKEAIDKADRAWKKKNKE